MNNEDRNEDRLEELLNRWEDLRDAGRPATEEEVCRDCPELLSELRRRTAKLKKIGRLLDGEMPEARDELTAAGRYRPLELHAHGGLGEVFRARDDELGREVALKRIRAREATDSQRADRFRFEAEITGRLDHPGVVPVYGLGRDASGRLYYAMRFIQGETLQQAIEAFHRDYPVGAMQRGAGAFQKLIRSFLSVCQTIAYAHRQEVIHRDLKPANIMLGHYGETLVVDWGLAKRLPPPADDDAATLTTAPSAAGVAGVADQTMLGQIKGSPSYMSPEQAEGRTDLVGPRSDVYSLGATLYTILTGRLPFGPMPFHELLARLVKGDFPPPRQIRGDVPPALEAICLKAMSHHAADRYATALELAADIEHWLADDPVSAWREPWTVRAARWVRKHQTLASTAAAALLVALLGFAVLSAQQRHSNKILGETNNQLLAANQNERTAREKAVQMETEARDAARRERDAADAARRSQAKAEQAEQAARKSEMEARAAESRARRELYAALVLTADRALDNGDRAFAAQSLDQCPAELRNVEWRLLYRRALGSRRTWRVPAGGALGVAISADGKYLAAVCDNGPVRIWNRADDSLVAELAGSASQVAFLPDGDRLLLRRTDSINLPLRDGSTARAPLPQGAIELWSIRERKRLARVTEGADRFAVSGDGRRLAVVEVSWPQFADQNYDISSTISVYDVPTGRWIASSGRIVGEVIDAAFSPDGRRIFCAARQANTQTVGDKIVLLSHQLDSESFRLEAWDLAAGQKKLQRVYSKESPANADAAALAITPDGKRIFVADKNRQVVSTGPTSCRITTGRLLVFDAAQGEPLKTEGFDLDAADVVSVEQKQRPVSVPSTLEAYVSGVAVSPDGKRLAAVEGHRIYVFDLASGKRLAELAGHLAAPQGLVFDRDGASLFTAGGNDGRVKQWDLARPFADHCVLPCGQASENRGIAFSHDSCRFAVALSDGRIGIYDTATQQPRLIVPRLDRAVSNDKLQTADALRPFLDGLRQSSGGIAGEICFAPDGKRLTAIYEGRFVCVWDISTDEPRAVDFVDELALETDHSFRLFTHLLLSPDGKYLASESYRGNQRYYRVWDVAARRLVVSHEKDDSIGMEPAMLFSGDSRIFYLGRNSPQARPNVLAWNLETGKPTSAGRINRLVASTEQVSPDGFRQLRIAGGVLQITDHNSGRTLIEYAGQDAYLWAIFSRDGRHILACKYKTAELFDASPVSDVEPAAPMKP